MIKRRAAKTSDLMLSNYIHAEIFFSQVLGALFEEECIPTYLAQKREFLAERSWLVCRHEAGYEFGIAVDGEVKEVARAEHFSQLVRLAQFSQSAHSRLGVIIPSWNTMPEREHAFSIRSRNGACGYAYFACSREEFMPTLLSDFGEGGVERPQPILRCELEARVEAADLKADTSIRADILLRPQGSERTFSARMSCTEGRTQIFLEREETPMSNSLDGKGHITLALGAIELSMDELLRLRPGMCIEFDAPETFEGMLLVHGAPWLEAQVTLEDRVLKVKVASSLGEIPVPSVSEETTEQKLRLVS